MSYGLDEGQFGQIVRPTPAGSASLPTSRA
jgi:hypothetical protein